MSESATSDATVRRIADEVHARYGIGGTVRRIIRDALKAAERQGYERGVKAGRKAGQS
jgi:hypothetical protein